MIRPGKRTIVLVGIAVLVLIAGVVAAAVLLRGDAVGAQAAARTFAGAWSAGKLEDASFDRPSAEIQAEYSNAVGGLAAVPREVTVTAVDVDRNRATARLRVKWNLSSGPWEYDSSVPLRTASVAEGQGRTRREWQVQWSRAVAHPALAPDTRLSLIRTQPPRADIVDRNGGVLVTARPVVVVGVTPQRAPDVDGLVGNLARLLDIDGPALAGRIKAAKPDAFVEVVTLRREDYEARRASLQPLEGVVFQEKTAPLAPTREFASGLLGRVAPVTAEVIEKSNGRYQAGDLAGVAGLQAQYDERLAGTVGVEVQKVGGTVPPQVLHTAAPVPGTPLKVALEPPLQNAAEEVLKSAGKPAALVAVAIDSGDLLAVANGPEAGGMNRAMVGQYPPGSSFKIISTYALLQTGLTAEQTVNCPPTIAVNGRSFRNAEDESFGATSFRNDFAHSCNTAFVSLSSRFNSKSLTTAASQFAIGGQWNLGYPAFTGSVPETSGPVDLAAATIGQGRVLVSPVAMANAAACVARGSCAPPRLVIDPPTTPAPAPSTPLDPAHVATLQSLLREVVTAGTGTAALKVPGAPVHAKTGTAEFGTEVPPRSHAWFVGYRGNIAFAVLVEGGEFGGETAAPLAAQFLTKLPE